MPGNRPNRLPAAVGLLIFLLVGTVCAPAAAAQYTIDTLPFSHTLEHSATSEYSEILTYSVGGTWSDLETDLVICAHNVQYWPSLSYVTATIPKDCGVETQNGVGVFYRRPSDNTIHPARLYIQKNRNILNQVTATVITIFPQNWEVGSATGLKVCPLYYDAECTQTVKYRGLTPNTAANNYLPDEFFCSVYSKYNNYGKPLHSGPIAYTGIGYTEWRHNVEMVQTYGDYIEVTVNRQGAYSLIAAYSGNENIFRLNGTENINQIVPKTFGTNVTISAPSLSIFDEYIYQEAGGAAPVAGSVTVYVQNSQTGALLANANLAILAAAGGTETEIISTTLPGGTATYTLQPTGGGSPNPDYYRAVATVPGYTQIVENHSFTLNGPHDVIIEMRPDTGGPLDPDRAYLEFYVRDIHANPISSASVQCDGRIKTTNSQGYAVFEVAKNATYPYTVSKSGYMTIQGSAIVVDGPRYVANVVLGPGTVPTYTPTLGPGETPGGPGATPTPDTRTNEQKGQAIIDLIADFAEPIALLAIVATVFGLMQMMMPRRR